jgi:truncated hemoglobin YjbI
VFEQLAIDDELTIQGFYPNQSAPPSEDRAKYPPPDPVLWAALNQGELMMTVLQDFYGRVYQDPLLSPYFHGTTMLRSIEKVYSFMRQVCTGEAVFFGDRPKNSHHWMVISDAIYQHRENLMRDCQRRAGLSAEMTERWMAIENYYRQDIIKSEPWKRTFAGVELPLEGFGEMVLDSGSMCDGCGEGIEVGETVRYHLRLGTVYCGRCNGKV